MNHGRIEQVDDPVTLYNVPRTRFVAGFIGRTNFLDGRLDGDRIVFPGFSVPAALAPAVTAAARGVSFAVRPQTIAMHRTARSIGNGGWWVEGRIVERAYLGEYWEYVVRPASGELRLRVTTPPNAVHEADESVWLEIDPARIARIPSPEGSVP
jgi:iron(III) transport system ATP-binding protein